MEKKKRETFYRIKVSGLIKGKEGFSTCEPCGQDLDMAKDVLKKLEEKLSKAFIGKECTIKLQSSHLKINRRTGKAIWKNEEEIIIKGNKNNKNKEMGQNIEKGEKPKLFAITTEEGHNEFFWDKEKAQTKIDTEYKKDFPSIEFWVDEVKASDELDELIEQKQGTGNGKELNYKSKEEQEQYLREYGKWLMEIWNPNQLYIPFSKDAPTAFLDHMSKKDSEKLKEK